MMKLIELLNKIKIKKKKLIKLDPNLKTNSFQIWKPGTYGSNLKNLFKSKCKRSYDDCKKFLDKTITPVLTSKKANICE